MSTPLENRLCGFDVETPQDNPEYGLQPWRAKTGEASIKSFAAWSEDGKIKCAKRMPSVETLRKFLMMAAAKRYVLVGWNVVFDVAWLCAIGLVNEVKACRWLDGMLALKRVDGWRGRQFGGPGYGLKEAVAHHCLADDYAIDATKVPETEEEWMDLLRYNRDDSKYTVLLCRLYLKHLSDFERRGLYVECAGIPDVALSYVTGISINEEAIKPFEVDVRSRAAMAKLGAPEIGMDVVRSPKKLRKLLFEDWGYKPVKHTPKNDPATDKESLLTLSIIHPEDERFVSLMTMRKCNTQMSKFIGGTVKSVAYNGAPITYPSPQMSGTYSGRFTYSSTQGKGKGLCQTGIALHQWERGPSARNLLMAPPGYLLAEFDFSGQEMRLMAIESGDEVMLELFDSGGDGHAYMGASIEQRDYNWVRLKADTDDEAKKIRNLGKFCVMEGQCVLTPRGLVPIQCVLITDRVWDGVEWVRHSGAVYQGRRDVIYYQGIWLTPDHIVWTEDNKQVEFQQAAREGLHIARTGDGGRIVRGLDDNKHGNKEGVEESGCVESALQVWRDEIHYLFQPILEYIKRLPFVRKGKNKEGQSSVGVEIPLRKNCFVWDITNAGPRSRYTVENLLVSNSNLSLQYRIGVPSIQARALTGYGLQLTSSKAAHIKKTYLKTYKSVPKYWDSAQAFAKKHGYAETRGHRRIMLNNLREWDQQQTAINFPIQGTGGCMKALAIAIAKDHFNEDFIYGWDLHDALFVYVKDDEKARGKVVKMKHILSNLPYKKAWGWSPPIALPVDAKLGSTWGTLKGVD